MDLQPTVLIADDHRMVAQGIANSLGAWYNIVGIVTSLTDIAWETSRLTPDVLLLDLMFDLQSALPVIPVVLKAHRATRIVVLTGHATQELADVAILAGAHGFVFKTASSEELRVGIAEALAGRIYISHPVPNVEVAARPHALRVTLTEIEHVMLESLCLGHTQAEAAKEASVTQKDVEYHLAGLRSQLGFTATTQLVEWYTTWRRRPAKKRRRWRPG